MVGAQGLHEAVAVVFGPFRGVWTAIDWETRTIKQKQLLLVSRLGSEPSRGKRIPYSAPGDAGDAGASSSVAPSFNTGGSRHQLNNPSRS